MFQGPAAGWDEVFICEGGAEVLGDCAQGRGGIGLGGDEVDSCWC